MRFILTVFLVSLTGAWGIAAAQVSAKWDQLIEDGAALEDDSKYKQAEKLFAEACDVSLAEALGAERLTRACLMLSRTYAVQGRWGRAAEAAKTLVHAQRQLANASKPDQTRALIVAAEAEMANANYGDATKSVEEAIGLAQALDQEAAAATFVDISTFYMPSGNKGFGKNLMDSAIEALERQPRKDTTGYLRAATKVGRGLGAYDRWADAAKLVMPLVEAAERRYDVEPEYDELWRAYSSAASVAIAAFKGLGDEREADRISELEEGWPDQFDEGSDEYTKPTLARKVDPHYSEGARRNQVSGLVVLSIVVGADGRAHDVQIEQSLPYGLSWEAVRAVRQWRFKPARLGDEAISINATVEVNFRFMQR